MRGYMVSFENTQNKASSVVLNLFVVCIRDTKDSQTKENCSSPGIKEQKAQTIIFCGIYGQKMTDGTNTTEFKISSAYEV